jgi:hypothetical protein
MMDPRLLDYAETDIQRQAVEAVIKHGSNRKAAVALGCDHTNVDRIISRVKASAARKGYAPGHWNDGVAPGYLMGKVTVQRKDGEVERTWERQSPDFERWQEMARELKASFLEDVPQIPCQAAPQDFQNDIIPWIQIGDAHIGMLAHAAEVGENFDLKIAERELCGAVAMLIDEMPPCERLVINDLGDASHYDNLAAVTSASGHPLDADGRHHKMLRVYSRTMRFIVDRALTKAKFVDVLINQGNHSRINDFWMREVLEVAYTHTGRVNVLDNDSVFISYRMGNTLVMVHHSDKCPPAKLVGVMTTDFRKDYGETQFHYIDTGHVHHHFVSKEHPGIVIESWNHLAASDKWAHDAGYRSRKAISVVLRSRTYGEVGRRLLPIEEIQARLAKAHGCPVKQAKEVYTV